MDLLQLLIFHNHSLHSKKTLLRFLFFFLALFSSFYLSPLTKAVAIEKMTFSKKNELLSLPLLNFNTRIKKFTLGQTQEREIYIDITFSEPFNAYQGRPYFREEDFSPEQVISYVKNKPEKHFTFNLSLIEKRYSLSFKGQINTTNEADTIRLFLPKEPASFPILASLSELQKLYTAHPHFTLLFNILNYNVDIGNKAEGSIPLFDRFNYFFYAEKGHTLKKIAPPSPHEPIKIQASFKGVQRILVIPYDGPAQESESIETFLNIWTKGADNFQVSPPNGYVYTKDTNDTYVRYDIRFLNPTYNPDTQELTFQGEFLQSALTGEPVIPSVLTSSSEFSTPIPTFVAVDWGGYTHPNITSPLRKKAS